MRRLALGTLLVAGCGGGPGAGGEGMDLASPVDLAMPPPPDLVRLADLVTHDLQWKRLATGFGDALYAAGGLGDTLLVVGGGPSGGVVHQSDDRGATWGQRASGTGETLYDLQAVAADAVFAVGGNGTVLLSESGGRTWRKLTSGTTAPLRGLFGTVSGSLWAVGDAGVIRRSVNFGLTWSPLSAGVDKRLSDVWGSGIDDVYVVGEGGTILHSQGGGAFAPLVSGTSVELTAVWGSGRDDVWVGGAKILLRSTDGGANWKRLPGPCDQGTVRGIWGASATDVYLACDGVGVVRSRDRGASFRVDHSDGASRFGGLWGRHGSEVYVVGQGGLVLRGT